MLTRIGNVMFAAIDSTGIDMQPIMNNNQAWIPYFVGFILICGYIAMNLFIGVVRSLRHIYIIE